MRQPLSWRRGGLVALLALMVVAAAALVLDMSAGGEYDPILDRLAEGGTDPVALVEELARTSRIVVLSDVHGRAGPKRVAAEAIRRLAEGPGLDAVVLEVPSSEQRYIDSYLTAVDDDATALLSRSAAVQEQYGVAREYLAIYEAVRQANRGLDASSRVRVVAADVEDWPPPEGAAPRDIGAVYAGRARHMLDRIDREVFRVMPDARVLVFVDGYQALQGTHGTIQVGGGDAVRVEWLGELLRRRSGTNARTILMDTGRSVGGMERLPVYHGTVLHRALRRERGEPVGSEVAGALAEVRDPILELSTPGLSVEILPDGYRLGSAAQGYIFLPGGR